MLIHNDIEPYFTINKQRKFEKNTVTNRLDAEQAKLFSLPMH